MTLVAYRIIHIGLEEKRAVSALVEFASRPERWYRPELESGAGPPGDNPDHVLELSEFRCVFSLTVLKGALYRHLSVSVPGAGNWPNPIMFCAIAGLFGFTTPPNEKPGGPEILGFGKNWQLQREEASQAIQVAEKIRDLEE